MKNIGALNVVHPRWKVLLWEKNSIEPAMLRVPIIIIVFVIMWSVALFILDKLRVDYTFVLTPKTTPIAIVFATGILLAAQYAASMTLMWTLLGFPIETSISLFYLLMLALMVVPLPTAFSETRTSFWRLLRNCFLPGSSIHFSEVLLADCFTSLSKVLKDMGISLFAMYAFMRSDSTVDYHNHAMVAIALLASLPYYLRVRQCTVQLYGCGDLYARVPVVLNIIKYCTAFPPIWLTAYASLGYRLENMARLITFFATLNSLYSFLWDVIMDWGMLSISRQGKFSLRPRIMLPAVTYFLATLLNLALRFAWLINRLPGMDRLHSSVIVLAIELGEVFRRSMWMLYRIEWEVIVQHDRAIEKDPVLAEKLRINKNPSI
ncbi:EXS family-domain-containing protein [Ochromonadaceae sp. CCMP2298]|nr:EXS family-domain-containing protein [Ochromonadaceae sp. CCMP2298]|mmetsp:Transcript_22532/g.50081  ORF Transcript_22532/g.50081 Transcript_22532/m.50081 type:complete len:377 (-) Transcript_22532:158-1288(-)